MAPLDRRGPSKRARFGRFSAVGGGIVAVSEPGTGLVGVGDIFPLREVNTGSFVSGSVGSEACGSAARNEWRPCASDLVRGSERGPVGAGEESTAIWETCGTRSVEEVESMDDEGSTDADR
jgi:hypothetical protein